MKSYFAKLAARATLANTPASPAANKIKVSDPFADTPPPGTPFAACEVGKTSRSTKEISDFPLSRPSQAVLRPENVDPISDTSASPSPESLDHPTTLQPKPLTTISPAETAATKKETPAVVAPDKRPQTTTERPTTEPGPPKETLPPLIPVALSPTHSTTSSADEAANSRFSETGRTENHLAEIQREQSMLLRKADTFMEQLFNRRSESTTNAEIDSKNESRSTLKPKIEPDQAPRLQPIQAPARMLDQKSDQPSLVIGKLTVEVVPPAPAPVVPRQQVVVVRGTRGGRNGIPSGRRFGLGQF